MDGSDTFRSIRIDEFQALASCCYQETLVLWEEAFSRQTPSSGMEGTRPPTGCLAPTQFTQGVCYSAESALLETRSL